MEKEEEDDIEINLNIDELGKKNDTKNNIIKNKASRVDGV